MNLNCINSNFIKFEYWFECTRNLFCVVENDHLNILKQEFFSDSY